MMQRRILIVLMLHERSICQTLLLVAAPALRTAPGRLDAAIHAAFDAHATNGSIEVPPGFG